MPALEALQDRMKAANTVAIGVSVDSIYSHANWGKSLGGVSFPLVADFHEKGAMAKSYGLYLADQGITDRATVIIDASGVVKHASSTGPAGQRDIGELVGLCKKVNSEYSGDTAARADAPGVTANAKLYVQNGCGFSRAVLLARDNLHLGESVSVHNISEDGTAKEKLAAAAGKPQVPALVMGDKVMHESGDIISYFVSCAAPL